MLRKTIIITIAGLGVFTSTSLGLTPTQIKTIKDSLSSGPVPELPAKAAALVKNADKKDRDEIAALSVKTILENHKGAASIVVSSISKAVPDVSPTVAKTAANQVPESRESIERAAHAAAPQHSAAISVSLGKSVGNPFEGAKVISPVRHDDKDGDKDDQGKGRGNGKGDKDDHGNGNGNGNGNGHGNGNGNGNGHGDDGDDDDDDDDGPHDYDHPDHGHHNGHHGHPNPHPHPNPNPPPHHNPPGKGGKH